MADRDILVSVHALSRSWGRGISVDEVAHVLQTGRIVEQQRGGDRRLWLGWVPGPAGLRPLHVVDTKPDERGRVIVVTAYYPNPARWDETFTRRIR